MKTLTLLLLVAVSFTLAQQTVNTPQENKQDVTVQVQTQEQLNLRNVISDLDIQKQINEVQKKLNSLTNLNEKQLEQKKEQLRQFSMQLRNEIINELPIKTQEKVKSLIDDMDKRIKERQIQLKEIK